MVDVYNYSSFTSPFSIAFFSDLIDLFSLGLHPSKFITYPLLQLYAIRVPLYQLVVYFACHHCRTLIPTADLPVGTDLPDLLMP